MVPNCLRSSLSWNIKSCYLKLRTFEISPRNQNVLLLWSPHWGQGEPPEPRLGLLWFLNQSPGLVDYPFVMSHLHLFLSTLSAHIHIPSTWRLDYPPNWPPHPAPFLPNPTCPTEPRSVLKSLLHHDMSMRKQTSWHRENCKLRPDFPNIYTPLRKRLMTGR